MRPERVHPANSLFVDRRRIDAMEIYLSVKKNESTTGIKGIQRCGHGIDGITGALRQGMIKIEEVDRYRHAREGGRRGKQSVGYEDL